MLAVCFARLAVTGIRARSSRTPRTVPAARVSESVMIVIWSSRGHFLGAGSVLPEPQFVFERPGAALAQG